MPSGEHQILVDELDRALHRYSRTGLLGVAEAERRKLDYGCLLLRDMSRPLIAQALWANERGIEKDLRTLLLDREAALKVYLVPDDASYHSRIAEIVQAYRADPALREKLVGFRLLTVPIFNADSESDRRVVSEHLDRKFREDILFGVVFGKMTAHNFAVFADHNGPLGLKYAILDEIGVSGLVHMPTFKQRLGYKTDGPIRQALTMLAASGFVRRIPRTNVCIPTVKGRLMLDLSRRLLFEWKSGGKEWAPETRQILAALGLEESIIPQELLVNERQEDAYLSNILFHAECCRSEYGRDLIAKIDPANPTFYSEFQWQHIFSKVADIPGVSTAIFDDLPALFFARGRC
jgi:hypothetical protein